VYQFTSNGIDVDELWARLRKMTDKSCSALDEQPPICALPRPVIMNRARRSLPNWRKRGPNSGAGKRCEESSAAPSPLRRRAVYGIGVDNEFVSRLLVQDYVLTG
jgi:hypothetical protein